MADNASIITTLGLSTEQLAHFDQFGYVIKPGVYAAGDLSPLRASLDHLVGDHAERLAADGQIDNTFAGEGFERRLARIWEHYPAAGEAIEEALGSGRYHGAPMLAMIRHQPLLACIRDLVGETIIGSAVYRIRPKAPAAPRGAVPWHQDSGYLLAHCDRFLIVTCWIPLVDATVENGCLYVIPGAHRQGVLRHYTEGTNDYLEVAEEELPDREPVPVEMSAGDVLFMTNLTPHASFANRSDVVRWSVDLRYQGNRPPNNVHEEPESYVPEREPITMACYPPEADFVISDPSAPEREVVTGERFEQIRARYDDADVYTPGRGWVSMTTRKPSR